MYLLEIRAMQINQDFFDADEDAKLIAKIQNTKKGFEELVSKYQHLVFRYSLTCTGKNADAEDLTQEVFLKLYENIQKINTEKPLVHWLLKITKNANINFLNKKKNEKKALKASSFGHETKPEEATPFELNVALSLLEEKEHEMISMRYFQNMSCESIGKIYGISANAVSIQLYRTKNKLKQILKEQTTENKK